MVSQTKGDMTGGLWLVRQRGYDGGIVVSQTKEGMTGGSWLVRQRGV